MQALIRISAIKERAERIGLSLPSLCFEAGQAPSTVYRWLSGEAEPRLRHYEDVCEKLDALLRDHEAEVARHLAAVKQDAA